MTEESQFQFEAQRHSRDHGHGQAISYDPIMMIGAISDPRSPASTIGMEDGSVVKSTSSVSTPMPAVVSGHSLLRKVRFSGCLTGTFVSTVSLALAREVYTLQFGVRPKTLGPVMLFTSFVFPFCSPAAGYVMDRFQLLRRCVNRETWGRRAPWFAVHLIALSICGGLCYLPPSEENEVVMVIWLLVISLVAGWSSAVIFAAFESSRQELYPMKEERVIVESTTKILAGVGVGIGTVCMFPLFASTAFVLRLGISVVICAGTLLSMEAVPVLQDAQKPCSMELIDSIWKEWWTMLVQSRASLGHFLALRFWQGALEAVIVTFTLYHLAVVCGVTGGERQNWLATVGACLVACELVTLPIYTFAFKRDFLDMQRTCGVLHAAGCVCCPLLLKYVPMDSQWSFLVYLVCERLVFAPQTWFRANAFCWVVDEDCLRNADKRREATFAGLCNFIGNLGRASAAGFLYIGMSEAGLNTKNCSWHCNDHPDKDICVQTCELEVYHSQPERVRTYIQAVYYFVAPACQALCALHILCFPIRGHRLKELCARQLASSTCVPSKEVIVGKESLHDSFSDPKVQEPVCNT